MVHNRAVRRLLVLTLLLAACSQAAGSGTTLPDLPTTDPASFRARLASLDQPAVVNIWASWCLPCRSETPLLTAAHAQWGDRIAFIGVSVRDAQGPAKAFLEEFGVTFEQWFDLNGDIPADLGGFGVPITYFVRAGGEIAYTHSGIIDEQTLALRIDELLQGG